LLGVDGVNTLTLHFTFPQPQTVFGKENQHQSMYFPVW